MGGLPAGNDTMRIGPNLKDFAGNLMNQDNDAFNGEAVQDQYVTSFYMKPDFDGSPDDYDEPDPYPSPQPYAASSDGAASHSAEPGESLCADIGSWGKSASLFLSGRLHLDLADIADLLSGGPNGSIRPRGTQSFASVVQETNISHC